MSNIKFDKKVLFNSFTDINNIANTKIMKCYKTVFKKQNIIKNIGFFIFDFCILLNIIITFSFNFGYYNKLIEKINEFKKNILNRYKNTNKKINDNGMISPLRKNKKNQKNIFKNNNFIKLYNNNNLVNKKNIINKKKKKKPNKISGIINPNIKQNKDSNIIPIIFFRKKKITK